MQTNLNKSQAPEVNITKTGYRALFILMKLIEKPLSRDEILECLSADPIAKKDFSKVKYSGAKSKFSSPF